MRNVILIRKRNRFDGLTLKKNENATNNVLLDLLLAKQIGTIWLTALHPIVMNRRLSPKSNIFDWKNLKTKRSAGIIQITESILLIELSFNILIIRFDGILV